MVRHQEAGPERPDDGNGIALHKIAQVVRGDAQHRLPGVIDGDAFDGERDIVVSGTLALARARDRIQADMVRSPLRVGSRRHDADRLPFQDRERGRAEVQHDVPDVAGCSRRGECEVAGYRGHRGVRQRVQVHVRVRGRPRRRDGAPLAGAGFRRDARDVLGDLLRGALPQVDLRRQRVPAELLVERIGTGPGHLPPVVDGTGGAGGDARVAPVALRGVDDVVARVVRDRVDRARLLAGVAADADLRVDQVLANDFQRRGFRVHRASAS